MEPGSYMLHASGDLRSDADSMLAILAAFRRHTALQVTVVPEPGFGSAGAGASVSLSDRALWRPTSVRPNDATLILETSGTTGEPKLVRRPGMGAYLAAKPRRGSSDDRWLLTFAPHRWAGVSTLAQVLRTDASVVVPASLDAADIWAAAFDVTHVSLTPSVFRRLLLEAGEGPAPRIVQLTFGGEVATQGILDLAAEVFQGARITHTYASTEFGDICAVSDGCAGIPQESFAAFDLDAEGELHIGGRPTGDLWELRRDRYHFSGRVSEVVNVGGNKVSLASVEEQATAIRGVDLAQARAVSSPLLGSVIVLDYVGSAVEADVMRHFRATVARHRSPARVHRVSRLPLSSAGKLVRK